MFSLHISVQRALAYLAFTLASALLIVGCTPPWQHSNSAAATGLSPKPAAQQVLSAIQKNFRSVTTFHVTMKVENLGKASASQIQIRSADGDVIMPDKVKAQANVLFSGEPDPDTGIISLAHKLQKLTSPTDDVVNGVPCWRVNGLLDAKNLAFLTGGGVPAGTMLQTSACAGKADGLLYQLRVVGRAASNDTAQTSRSFTISGYNENITITAPQV